MRNKFTALEVEEKQAYIQIAAAQLNLPDMFVEKDFWVCWLLEKLFSLPINMAFKGGTSLSKVFGLIKRFSEDCDVTIDYRNFMPELEINQLTKSQLKKISDQLKNELKKYVATRVMPYLKEEVLKIFKDNSFEFQLSENGEQLKFYYPSVVKSLNTYLRDHVLIEFGVRNSTEPNKKYRIQSYLEQVIGDKLIFPNAIVTTLSPVRTFWEKVTLIHVECSRNRHTMTPERLARHWYDLFMLKRAWVGKEAIDNTEVLKSVIDHKKAFFNASYANYDDCIAGRLRLIPATESLADLRQDYQNMLKAGMLYGNYPDFAEIKEELSSLEALINERHLAAQLGEK